MLKTYHQDIVTVIKDQWDLYLAWGHFLLHLFDMNLTENANYAIKEEWINMIQEHKNIESLTSRMWLFTFFLVKEKYFCANVFF